MPFLIILSALFIIFNQTIFAQIDDLYSKENNEIAGISPLMDAVTNNDLDGVRFFSKSSAAVINQKNFGGATALHLAARQGNFEMARILIENGADVNVADFEGWTPLMRAAFFQNSEIVDLLLSNGAQAQIVNSIGESVIIHATISDCDKCLNLLFSKFNFIKYMGIATLKEQLSEAFIIARNHENKMSQNAIEGYLDKIIKLSPLIMTRNVAPQNQYYLKNQNDFEVMPTPTKPIYAPSNQELISAPIQALQAGQNRTNIIANRNEQIIKRFVFKGQIQSSSPSMSQTSRNTIYQTTKARFTPLKPITAATKTIEETQKIIPISRYSQITTDKITNQPVMVIKKFKFKLGPNGITAKM